MSPAHEPGAAAGVPAVASAARFWTLDGVREALGDGPGGHAPLSGVSTDTRHVAPGALFVALRGERFDAHEFLGDAVARGAAALVVSDASRAAGLGVPVYQVADTLHALGRLGLFRRQAWGGRVVAVAGSNGKTSTKELLRAAIGATRRVHASSGNFNNQVGVPLTLLAVPDEAQTAVVEVGTNQPGEIALLRQMTRPDVAVVTSIGEEHLEGFGDLAGVLEEESAIFPGVGLAVTPASQPEVARAARARGATRIVAAGLGEGDLRADTWHLASDGLGALVVRGVEVRPPLRGAHNLRNTMLALAVAEAEGVPLRAAAAGIAAMPVPPMRSAWQALGAATLLNDAYNANPASARAALDLLTTAGASRQRVAVLGTMRELGAGTDEMHDAVARYALASGADLIGAVGEFAGAFARVAPDDDRVVAAADVDELWTRLESRLAPDALILLKASRGMRLERLVPALERWAASRS